MQNIFYQPIDAGSIRALGVTAGTHSHCTIILQKSCWWDWKTLSLPTWDRSHRIQNIMLIFQKLNFFWTIEGLRPLRYSEVNQAAIKLVLEERNRLRTKTNNLIALRARNLKEFAAYVCMRFYFISSSASFRCKSVLMPICERVMSNLWLLTWSEVPLLSEAWHFRHRKGSCFPSWN